MSAADTDRHVAYRLDGEGRITSLNPAFEAITGRSRADWIGRLLSRLIHPDDAGRASETHREVLTRERTSTFSARILSRTGEYVDAEFTAVPHRTPGRAAVVVAGVARVFRGPGRTAPCAPPEGAAHGVAAETGAAAIVCADGAGRIVHFDRAAERMFCCRADDVRGRQLTLLVGERFRAAVGRRLASLLAPGEAGVCGIVVEAAGRRADGSEFPLEASLASWRTDAGDFVMAILRDTTERTLAHRALRRMNETREDEARRIARELHDEAGQLLASVHIALLEWARGMPGSSAGHLQRVKGLLDQIEGRLRDLSHELRPTMLDDLGLLPALEFLAGRVARRTGLLITVDGTTGGRLPPRVETALYRVTQEALTNVARHARAASVSLRLDRQDRAIRYAIRDDGIGFDVPASLGPGDEHGLGLIGIRERVASLGGTVRIEAARDRGTTLIVVLPLED